MAGIVSRRSVLSRQKPPSLKLRRDMPAFIQFPSSPGYDATSRRGEADGFDLVCAGLVRNGVLDGQHVNEIADNRCECQSHNHGGNQFTAVLEPFVSLWAQKGRFAIGWNHGRSLVRGAGAEQE